MAIAALVIAAVGVSPQASGTVDETTTFSAEATVLPNLSAASNQPAADAAALGTSAPDSSRSLRRAVRYYEAKVRSWRSKRGLSTRFSSRAVTPFRAHVLQRKARAARRAYERWFRATYEKYRCLHEHEGAWNSATGNGYWGGLQMDWGFQHTYGPEFIRRYGLANRWPVYAQLIAAERAFYGFAGFGGRGYSPWGTRGRCGL